MPSTSQPLTGQLMVSTSAAVLGAFVFGFNTGVINAPQNVVKQFINGTNVERTGQPMDEDYLTLVWSVIVAVFAGGGMVGGVSAGVWAEKLGRRKGLMLVSPICLSAAVLFLISAFVDVYELLIVGRLVVGFVCGLYTGIVPVYLSEIAHRTVRGAFGILNQLGVVLALLLSQILGLEAVMGNSSLWNYLLAVNAVPAVLQFVLLVFSVESPRYLFISRGERDKATRVLTRLRHIDPNDDSKLSEELDELAIESSQVAGTPKVSILMLLFSGRYNRALLVSVVLHLSQQLSGINVIFYYSSELFQSAGLTEEEAGYATIGVGAIMVVMTFVSIPLIDVVGRRVLHLAGLLGMLVCGLAFTGCLLLREHANASGFSIPGVVFCLIFVVFFAVGPGSIPWMIVGELFTQGARPAAISVATCINWIANGAVGLAFPHMLRTMGSFVFVPFTSVTLLFVVVLWIFMPETKGRTFAEIEAELYGGGADEGGGDALAHADGSATAVEPGSQVRLTNYKNIGADAN